MQKTLSTDLTISHSDVIVSQQVMQKTLSTPTHTHLLSK